MGGVCAGFENNKKERETSKNIDKQLRNERNKKQLKLLLLGTGESGKSTVLKQFELFYLNKFTEEERKKYIPVIHQNIFTSIMFLIDAVIDHGEKNFKPENSVLATEALDRFVFSQELTTSNVKLINCLWNDPAVQSAYKKRDKLQLIDSAKYFLDDIHRISAEEYIPTIQDVLQSRAKTLGITEVKFQSLSADWKIVDIAGQRSERRKWIHCFDNVSSIIYCSAISEYNRVLAENSRVNRMVESLELFEKTINNEFFSNTPVILFFNKNDLFQEKIKKVDMNCVFKDYTGGCNYKAALEYLETKFKAANQNKKRRIFIHTTCAVDTENISAILRAVTSSVVETSLQYSDLM